MQTLRLREGRVMQGLAGRTLTISTGLAMTGLAALAVAGPALADEQAKRDAFAAVGIIDAADLDELRGREGGQNVTVRSEEHTSELQSLMRNSYAVFCLQKKKRQRIHTLTLTH